MNVHQSSAVDPTDQVAIANFEKRMLTSNFNHFQSCLQGHHSPGRSLPLARSLTVAAVSDTRNMAEAERPSRYREMGCKVAQVKALTAQEAFNEAHVTGSGHVVGVSSAFLCPYPDCRVVSQHQWGIVNILAVLHTESTQSGRTYQGSPLNSALCQHCKQEVLFLGKDLIWPRLSEAPPPAIDLPEHLYEDYNEASAICQTSPRGAAALLRLLIQKLCAELGAPQKDVNAAIGHLVETGVVSAPIQKALDAVRVVGNEAVHPGTMDLRDDTATVNSLFGLINFIVEKAITEPREIDAIYSSLPAGKLAGIAQRDIKTR